MYLKRMEIVGFKSFADRTELEFVPGVTAVVGPNGSGKSNISDSIRWVLGEQSAKSLRGAKMEDVIFVGSDSRKAVNYCEVSLTLDNSDQVLPLDFNEVTITRRVYRSGEGEYLINKQSCRLRDIVELFMDTGLGREAYSIIGQGRIEEILSTKSEERRGIFEEAAGIVKYKSRKREAEKKLEETEANLVRVHDILSELESQIGPLFEQSQVAQRYKVFKEELQRYEIALYVYEIEDIHTRWQSGLEEGKQLQDELTAHTATLSTHEAEYQQVRWQMEQLDQMLEVGNQGLVDLVSEFEKSEGRREVLQERYSNLLVGREEILVTFNKLQQAHEETAVALANETETRVQVADARDRLRSELEDKLGAAKAFFDRAEQENELERLKTDYIEQLNDAAGKRNEQKNVDANVEALTRRMEKLTTEESDFVTRLSDLELQLTEWQKQLDGQTSMESDLQKKLALSREAESNAKDDLERLQQALRELQTERASVQSRLELLRDMQQEYGGFAQGVRHILQASDKNRLQGICGAVADLLHVPSAYETAIETALGGAVQNVVVETEKAGRDAIAMLKSSGGGRATFMPLSVIKGRSLGASERSQIERQEGFIGIAAEMIEFDSKYRPIAEYLLGQVVVAKAIADANQLAKILNYRVRIVTLDGDVVNPGGTMAGGSIQKKGTSLLGRQREVDEMEKRLATVETKLTEAQSKFESSKAILQNSAAIQQDLIEQIEQARTIVNGTQGERRELEAQRVHFQDRLQGIRLELEQYRSEHRDLTANRAVIESELALLEEQTKTISTRIDELQQLLKEQQNEQEDLSEEVTEVKVRLATLDQELSAVDANIARINGQIRQLQTEMEAKEQEQIQMSERIQQTQTELEDATLQWQRLDERRREKELSLTEERARKAELQKRLAQAEHQVREIRQQLKLVEQRSHQNEVRVTRLDVELNNLLTKLSEEYHISFEWAKQNYPLVEDVSVTKRKTAEFRREIQALGDVNIGAIEEHSRVEERLTFLTTQSNDLIEAKQKLYEIIAEINEEMSNRFQETFEAIRAQFTDVFAQLFVGGRADLVLVDPENLLTTGIDIVAQPPGKKLQNLSLLSGGERALTAIALLFAILRVKPVPFCVLDEVEAALDESNVSRFAEYMREFSSETQFICITHRKGTMENADVLYGVTMEESGISKLVSVKLIEQEVQPA